MLDNAWAWADKHHKKRKNGVHGEEEICCILDDEFLFRAEQGESMSQQGDFQLEERFGNMLFPTTIPENTSASFQVSTPYMHDTSHSPPARTLMPPCWTPTSCHQVMQVRVNFWPMQLRRGAMMVLKRMIMSGLIHPPSSFLANI